MHPTIDLIDYADHSIKIPSVLLIQGARRDQAPKWKIVLSYWMDFIVVALMSSMMSIVFTASNSVFLLDRKLQQSITFTANSFSVLMGLTMMTYFFICFFMNQGQSIGMFSIKQRVSMEERNLYSSLKWSFASTIVCLTGGMAVFFTEHSYKMTAHDYLYLKLISPKHPQRINLLEKAESTEVPEFEKLSGRAA